MAIAAAATGGVAAALALGGRDGIPMMVRAASAMTPGAPAQTLEEPAVSDEQQPIKSGAARPTGKRQLSGVATTSSQTYADKRVVRVEGKKDDATVGGGVAATPES